MGEVVIKATTISKSYDNGDSLLKVLDRISMEITSGEIVTIMGQSGAGK
jgi:ABC-type antimicrobial peptide transport system, ATPase component